jgi:hypothetical protein
VLDDGHHVLARQTGEVQLGLKASRFVAIEIGDTATTR